MNGRESRKLAPLSKKAWSIARDLVPSALAGRRVVGSVAEKLEGTKVSESFPTRVTGACLLPESLRIVF